MLKTYALFSNLRVEFCNILIGFYCQFMFRGGETTESTENGFKSL